MSHEETPHSSEKKIVIKDFLPVHETKIIHAFIDSVRWQEAKLQPPHSYTVKQWSDDSAGFEGIVRMIRTFGHEENFYNETYIYLTIGVLKYWTMGAPIEETTVLNRADAGIHYGMSG